jgi:phosphatidylserine decarboxylase
MFIIWFYRLPQNYTPSNYYASGVAVIAPSWGTVYKIIRNIDEIHIVVFLSPLDVHFQYIPFDCKYLRSQYDRTGRFHLANMIEKSRFNEKKMHWLLEPRTGNVVKIVQVAGFLTRNIESWAVPGEMIRASTPFGIIHFGSRVDIHLPNDAEIFIKQGDKLEGGKKIIALLSY